MDNSLKLHGVIIQSSNGGFTGYFSEFPEAIAEGETEEETRINLFHALREVLLMKKELYGLEEGSSSFELNLEMA